MGADPILGGSILDELGVVSVQVAESIGMFLVDQRPGELAENTKSSPTDIVTQMDAAGEAMARQMIAETRPSDGFLGEEGTQSPGDSGITWVVDPIDGTTNYFYGLPLWGVSVAAVYRGLAVAGAVCAPGLGTTYSAVRGAGARARTGHGSHSLSVTACDELSRALIATGFGYDADRRVRQGSLVAGLLGRIRDIRRGGAASIDLCWVGAGLVDGYYEQGLHAWDFAAGALIVEEAGGIVTTAQGDDLWPADLGAREWGTIIAAGPGIHGALSKAVQEG